VGCCLDAWKRRFLHSFSLLRQGMGVLPPFYYLAFVLWLFFPVCLRCVLVITLHCLGGGQLDALSSGCCFVEVFCGARWCGGVSSSFVTFLP
jgi:hypothetical protein